MVHGKVQKRNVQVGPQPEQFAKNGSEHGHQVALFCWAAQHAYLYPELKDMFAIPNGGERNKAVAANLKAEGVKSSVPDIFLPAIRGNWHGMFIELKRPKSERGAAGRATDEQKDFMQRMKQRGYGAVVAIGWEQAKEYILQYLDWE